MRNRGLIDVLLSAKSANDERGKIMKEYEQLLKARRKHTIRLPISIQTDKYDIGIVAVQGETMAAAAVIVNRREDDVWAFVSVDLKNSTQDEMVDEICSTIDFDHLYFGSVWEIAEGLDKKAIRSSQGALDLMLLRWHTLHPESDSGEATLYVITSTMTDSGVSEESDRILIEFNGMMIAVEKAADAIEWMVIHADGTEEKGVSHAGSPVITAISLFMQHCTSLPDGDDVTVFSESHKTHRISKTYS